MFRLVLTENMIKLIRTATIKSYHISDIRRPESIAVYKHVVHIATSLALDVAHNDIARKQEVSSTNTSINSSPPLDPSSLHDMAGDTDWMSCQTVDSRDVSMHGTFLALLRRLTINQPYNRDDYCVTY